MLSAQQSAGQVGCFAEVPRNPGRRRGCTADDGRAGAKDGQGCQVPTTLLGMILGAHCSTAGGLHKALERAQAITGECAQIFVKNNMQWFGKPYLPQAVAQFAAGLGASKLRAVFGHAGYLINLAGPAGDNRDKSIRSLVEEIELASQIQLPFLVMHPGAHLTLGEAAGIKQIVQGLNETFRLTKKSRVRIALENTAGQGSCLGCDLKHLAAIYEAVDYPERLGICLDTAHFFAAGYDIRSPKGWDAALAELEVLAGLDQVLAFHLNDSKTDLGSRVDRHAHIGQGKIGLDAFRHIVNDARFREHPGCLETPKSDDLHEDRENLKVLRSLLVVSAPVPKSSRKPASRSHTLRPRSNKPKKRPAVVRRSQ
jgi:deoxyribonuclease IV